MRKYNRNLKTDINIVNALNSLPLKMKNKEGRTIKLRNIANTRESGKEHIADRTHGLQIKDIRLIPLILEKPFLKLLDPNHQKRINYYGKKYKNNKFSCYIKIVTQLINKDEEEIITIYLTHRIKN